MKLNYKSAKIQLSLLICLFFVLSSMAQVQKTSAIKTSKKQNYSSSVSLPELIKTKSSEYVITSQHISRTSGTNHTYLRQAINGLEVVGTESSVHTDSKGNTLISHNKFVDNIQATVKNASASLTAERAILSVSSKMGYKPSNLQKLESKGGINQANVFNKAAISGSDIPVKLLYYYEEGKGTRLVWELSVEELTSSDWWNFYVDAQTGAIIKKENWTVSCIKDTCGHAHKEGEENHSPESKKELFYTVENNPALMAGSYRVFPMPIESPNHGARQLVTNPDNALASPYGWHDTNGVAGAESNFTIGNNADAYDDSSSTQTGTGSGTDAKRADGGAGLNFDYTFNANVTQNGRSIKAAVSHLFYITNIIHDVMYQYGFDEASGNFQLNNYGRGGSGNDSVRAEAQDGSGTCNANFSTPVDGGRGRMQMYVCNTRDGDYDNGVVIHEYGHGISTRLTGGAGNSSCLNNQEQMGEGWSDFLGLLMTIESGDAGTDARGMGTWLVGQATTGLGIRTQRYDTDNNTYTYDSIKSEVAPHGVGSVWAMMLWEMTWELIDIYGWDADLYNGTGGNNIAMQLVLEGMKLQPCSPGFVDGRNAILLADQNIYGGANQCAIWTAFAKRGLGFSANQGSSNSKGDGIQAFDLPAATFALSANSFCDSEGTITGLTGGKLIGGVYSGPGVTDDGNGRTFTFDASVAGEGKHVVTYTDTCRTPSTTATDTITVTNGTPTVICQDATVTLDASGNATITQLDVVSNLFRDTNTYTVSTSGVYNKISVASGATTVSLTDDQGSGAISLGFDFSFFGNTFNNLYIASNGYLSFTNSGLAEPTNTSLPNSSPPNNLIAPVWDDLNPQVGGTIKYKVVGTAPNRVFVVDYENVPHWVNTNNSTNLVSTQVQLFESSMKIEMHSSRVNSDGGTRTQGIENANGTIAYTTPGRNATNWSLPNNSSDYVAFLPLVTASLAENCGNSVSLSLSQSAFTCRDIGTNLVTITADDGNGGVATCETTVTVIGETTTYNGSWSNGNPNAGKKAIFNTSYNTSVADIDACSCELTNNATVTVEAGDYLRVDGNITVNSGSTLFLDHEASLVQVDDNAIVTNNGNIIVRKNTPFLGPRDFMVLGSPMSTESRSGVYGTSTQIRNHITSNFVPHPQVTIQDPLAENFADDNGDDWVKYNGNINVGEGYLVLPQPDLASSGNYTFNYTAGTLNNGVVNYNVDYNGSQNASMNVVGNPYASAIDADLYMGANSMVNAVYFWEHITTTSTSYPGYKTFNYDMGDISMYNSSGGVAAANDPATQPNGFIASGQGFGFKATAAGTAIFNNAMRVTGNNNTYRKGNVERERIWLEVSNATYGLKSSMLVSFSEASIDGFDAKYDAKRMATPVSLYSILDNGEQLAIQGRSAFNQNQQVNLGFVSQVEENQEFTISINKKDGTVWDTTTVYLLDKKTGIVHNLSEADFVFSTSEGVQNERFTMLFNKETLGINSSELQQISLVPNPTTGILYIVSPKESINSVEVYDIRGRKLMQVDYTNNQYRLDLTNLNTATYFVKINTDFGTLTKRIIKK